MVYNETISSRHNQASQQLIRPEQLAPRPFASLRATCSQLEEGSGSLGFILSDRYKEAMVQSHPLGSEGSVKVLKQINDSAAWTVEEWGVFKTKLWTAEIGAEAATIAFVKEKSPNIPIPTVFDHHEDRTNNQLYLPLSWVGGQDLDNM